MTTTENPFEKYQELIAHLMLSHMSSFSIMTSLNSMRGHESILKSEAIGPLNEQQRLSLNTIINDTERLIDHLGVFLMATRLMYTPERIYENDCSLLKILDNFIEETQKVTDFQFSKNFPDSIPEFKADTNLIHHAINSIGRIIKHIHPTYKGKISLTIEVEGSLVRIIFSTNKDETIPPLNENPDLFIVQSVAQLHNGDFIVDISDKVNYKLTFTLSIKTFS